MTLALIPARGGSKSIKKKNLIALAGKPLLHYTIKAALEAHCIDEVLVSSDDEYILTYAKNQGVKTLKRPAELALDDTLSQDVLLHALKQHTCDHAILLQPTSPLRTSEHIDEAFELFVRDESDALISVCACDNKILKAFTCDKNGFLRGICNDAYPFMPRQKLPPTFISNGAIYMLKTKAFLKNAQFLQKRTKYYLMDENSSLDIDDMTDLHRAQILLQSKQS